MGHRHSHPLPTSKLRITFSKASSGRVPGSLPQWFLLFVCTFLFSCSSSDKPKVEAPPVQITQAGSADQIQQPSNLPPPELSAVQLAVKRVFKETAVIDTRRKPTFIAGDFNGDRSQDIAVVVQPAPNKLADLNEEFPNWILKDPFAVSESRAPRLRVASDDTMLAVIHGYGAGGWRDPQATQTFLLKNAAGSDMTAQQAKEVSQTNQGKKVPHFRGDVIRQVVGGTSGYLYFAEATYAWYDPKTFQGEPETGIAHMRAAKRNRR